MKLHCLPAYGVHKHSLYSLAWCVHDNYIIAHIRRQIRTFFAVQTLLKHSTRNRWAMRVSGGADACQFPTLCYFNVDRVCCDKNHKVPFPITATRIARWQSFRLCVACCVLRVNWLCIFFSRSSRTATTTTTTTITNAHIRSLWSVWAYMILIPKQMQTHRNLCAVAHYVHNVHTTKSVDMSLLSLLSSRWSP